jgi:hypothetical protein
VADTSLAPELLEASGLWQTATKRIITLMVSDFKLCPGEADKNPYRSALSRLPVNVSDSNSNIGSPTYPDSTSSPTAEPGGRLLALRLAPQSPAPFARSLGAKDTDAEREAAAEAWDSLARECGGFFDNLEDVARWGAETQNYVFAAIKAVRLVIVTNVQLRAAGATEESFKSLIKAAPAEGAGASLAVGADIDSKISKEDFDRASSQATTRAILYVRVSSMLAVARALLSDLCTSLAYSNPSNNIAAFINDASQPAFNIDGRCFVSSAANTTVDPVGALDVLFDPNSGFFGDAPQSPLYSYRKAVLSNLTTLYDVNSGSSQGKHVKSCAVPHARFVKSLLQRGGRAVIDVTPESFAADNMQTNSDCILNAEVRKVRVVFRAADGGILPRAESAVVVHVKAFNSASSSFFKYTETPTGIIEHAYTAPLRRQFEFKYKGTSATGECDSGFVSVVVGSQAGGGKYCAAVDASDSADDFNFQMALERLPVFGRWEFELGVNGWSAEVEEPVSVTLMFDLASACPGVVTPGGISARWSDIVRSPGRSAKQNMLGPVCGGQDFARFAKPPPALAPPSGSNLAVILGAVGGAIFLIAATAAVIIKGRNSRRALGPKASAITSSEL